MQRLLATMLVTFTAGAVVVPKQAMAQAPTTQPIQIRGRYPHLAMFNHFGECGSGAVVPWAGRLWVITYAPHQPKGSDDKLYEIDDQMQRLVRPESVGGTPANRMIHRQSNQLIVGPYFIDADRNVRVINPADMPGRLTATATHLTDPANKVYFYDMEGALFEADVHSLAVHKLFDRVAPGAHGKGAYTSQGHLIVSNNGQVINNQVAPAADNSAFTKDREAAGALAEWDGKTWQVLQRRQFTEITGPDGIQGAASANIPIWALGWDKRSVLLQLRDGRQWQTFRLPIADYSYVAENGYYTEWPRIREIGPGDLLMNMHGQWFNFPRAFAANHTQGIRPIADHLKITGDFCSWNNRLVFGCDDASTMGNALLGQSQSNLWFSSGEALKNCGRPSGAGGPWLGDAVKAHVPSDPFLLAGYDQRIVHLAHDSDSPVVITLEVDAHGDGQWSTVDSITVTPHGYAYRVLPVGIQGQWIRVRADRDCAHATAYFIYGPGGGSTTDPAMFSGLDDLSQSVTPRNPPGSLATLRPLAETGTLLFASGSGEPMELSADLHFHTFAGSSPAEPKSIGVGEAYAISADSASLIVTQAKQRYRLPIGSSANVASHRTLREAVTERFLLNAGGSFFMVPYPDAGGASRLKPICTHGKSISDFCTWRGLMVLAGTGKADAHFIQATMAPNASGAGVWLGDIDDLWRMGKPIGHGGPWLDTNVQPDEPSDAYLMAGYDHKRVSISHQGPGTMQLTLEIDAAANGTWRAVKTFEVPSGETIHYEFPTGFSAQWIRAKSNLATSATLQFDYE